MSGPFYTPDGDEYLVGPDGKFYAWTGHNAITNPRPERKAPRGRRPMTGR